MRRLLRVAPLLDERRARVQGADEVDADVRRLGPRRSPRRRSAARSATRPGRRTPSASAGPRSPASNSRRCQSVSHLRRSGHASRGGAGASCGRVASSQPRRSARKASSASEYRRSTAGVYDLTGRQIRAGAPRGGRRRIPRSPMPKMPEGGELPKIISVDDHVVEPAHLWDRWLPERYRARGPHVERRGIGSMTPHRRRPLRAVVRRRRPAGRLLGLRGPRLHQQAPRRRGRLRPRRHDDVADHLRRDAPGLLRARRRASTTWR